MATTTTPVPVPTLSVAGWQYGGEKKADFLLSHFFEANYSQTYLYLGNVISMQWLLQKYMKDIPGLCSAIQAALNAYLGRYYSEGLSVSVNNTVDASTGVVSLQIMATVMENGVALSFGKLVNVEGSTILAITNYINTGATS